MKNSGFLSIKFSIVLFYCFVVLRQLTWTTVTSISFYQTVYLCFKIFTSNKYYWTYKTKTHLKVKQVNQNLQQRVLVCLCK